jgi:hypothetical protein
MNLTSNLGPSWPWEMTELTQKIVSSVWDLEGNPHKKGKPTKRKKSYTSNTTVGPVCAAATAAAAVAAVEV